ncbi:MAG TPA: hypothetical protein VNJ01_03520 [Bacteriovoracaceae bacterium]|nr:hypothetical protein [Bacteriovoracaceae bacterium]
MKTLFCTLGLILSVTTFAKTSTFCGTRSGTAGNAYLTSNEGKIIFTLATQGRNQTFLRQADKILTILGADVYGELGMQNKTKYCVNAKIKAGRPVEVVGAYPMYKNIKTICGKRGGNSSNAYLSHLNGRIAIFLLVQGGSGDQFDQAERLLAEDTSGTNGMQEGVRYCVNVKTVRSRPVKVIGAFKE